MTKDSIIVCSNISIASTTSLPIFSPYPNKQRTKSQKSTDSEPDYQQWKGDRSRIGQSTANLLDDDNGGKFHTNPLNSKYKIQLCRNFMSYGSCPYDDRCQYAHGRGQLRYTCGNQVEINTELLTSNRKYKTKDCREFLRKGYCPYGQTCNYLHRQIRVKCHKNCTENIDKLIITDQGFKEIIANAKPNSRVLRFVIKGEKPVYKSGFNY